MLGRIEQDPLQIQPVGVLDLSPLGDRHPRAAQALGQLIANALKLAQIEQSRLRGAHAARGIQAAQPIGGHEGVGELPLQA